MFELLKTRLRFALGTSLILFVLTSSEGFAASVLVPGKVVYNTVVLHCDHRHDKLKLASTNYIGLDYVIPIGTSVKMKRGSAGRKVTNLKSNSSKSTAA